MTYGVCFGEISVTLYRYMASDVHKLPDSYSCGETILSAGVDASVRPLFLPGPLQRLRSSLRRVNRLDPASELGCRAHVF